MRQCIKCDAWLRDTAKVCYACGALIEGQGKDQENIEVAEPVPVEIQADFTDDHAVEWASEIELVDEDGYETVEIDIENWDMEREDTDDAPIKADGAAEKKVKQRAVEITDYDVDFLLEDDQVSEGGNESSKTIVRSTVGTLTNGWAGPLIIAIVLLAGLTFAGILYLSHTGVIDDQYLLYVKEGQLYAWSDKREDSVLLLDEITYETANIEYELGGIPYSLGYSCQNEANDRIIAAFRTKTVAFVNSYDLYMFNISKSWSKTLIDTDVQEIKTNEAMDRVYYRKGSRLYLYDGALRHILAENVGSFYCNQAGDRVLFTDPSEMEFYLMEDKAVVRRGNFGDLCYLSETLDEWVLLEDGKLLLENKEGKETIIDTDVAFICKAAGINDIYYLKVESHSVRLGDVIEDDMLAEDQNEIDSTSAIHRRKVLRDELAKSEDEMIEEKYFALHYYDGKQSKRVDDHVTNFGYAMLEGELLQYQTADLETSKIYLSTLATKEDLYSRLENPYRHTSSEEIKLAYKGDSITIGSSYVYSNGINEQETEYWYIKMDPVDFRMNFSFYRGEISEGKLMPAQMEVESASGLYQILENGQLAYVKTTDEMEYGVFVGEDFVDEGFLLWSNEAANKLEHLFYYKNLDIVNELEYWHISGDLMMYDGNERLYISDQALAYIINDQQVLYTREWDAKKNNGDLYLFGTDKKSVLIDERIEGITLPVGSWFRDYENGHIFNQFY